VILKHVLIDPYHLSRDVVGISSGVVLVRDVDVPVVAVSDSSVSWCRRHHRRMMMMMTSKNLRTDDVGILCAVPDTN